MGSYGAKPGDVGTSKHSPSFSDSPILVRVFRNAAVYTVGGKAPRHEHTRTRVCSPAPPCSSLRILDHPAIDASSSSSSSPVLLPASRDVRDPKFYEP